MYFAKGPLFSVILASVLTACRTAPDPAARLIDGQPVDNIRQFPHHVYIVPYQSQHRCGGSIVNAKWVLTSAICVRNSIRLELHFGKKSEFNNHDDYFTLSVNRDEIFVYPTNFDDLALIRLPVRLVFSETIAPVKISPLPPHALLNRFTVMPGFDDSFDCDNESVDRDRKEEGVEAFHHGPPRNDSLKYGMFKVMESRGCRKQLGSVNYNEYSQLCTEGWGRNPNTQCISDYGSGLIVGWPAKSELIGVFSMNSPICSNRVPGIYTFAGKYLSWIEGMIRG